MTLDLALPCFDSCSFDAFVYDALAQQSLPFPSGPTRKVPVAIGLTTFLVFGFSLPFIAAKFQIAKASW